MKLTKISLEHTITVQFVLGGVEREHHPLEFQAKVEFTPIYGSIVCGVSNLLSGVDVEVKGSPSPSSM